MKVSIQKHFNYLTPFSEAANKEELAKIMCLKYPKACSNLEVDASFFRKMVDEVKEWKAWEAIRCASFEEFCRDQLGKTLDEVEAIVSGVKILQAKGQQTISRKEAVQASAAGTNGDFLPEGRPPLTTQFAQLNRSERAKKNGISKRTQEKLDRLARDFPALHAKVITGELSAHAAAKQAGIVKVKTPTQIVERMWEKASVQDREALLELFAKLLQSGC